MEKIKFIITLLVSSNRKISSDWFCLVEFYHLYLKKQQYQTLIILLFVRRSIKLHS